MTLKKKIIVILFICLTIIFCLYFYIYFNEKLNKQFKITFFNIGQGDAALIRFENGEKMLVDCGIDRKILYKLGEVLPFYDRKIDYLLVTHPDADHYGGCPEVLKKYKVDTILANGEVKNSDPYWSAWEKYSKLANNYQIVRTSFKKEIAGAVLEFLSPDSELILDKKFKTSNNLSIVFRLVAKGKKFLFTGDMEQPLENLLLEKYCFRVSANCPVLRADFLKIGHHGSDSSTGENFLKAVGPKITIISVGKNSFGHPSFRVLKKIKRIDAEIWRTDEKNDIIIQ